MLIIVTKYSVFDNMPTAASCLTVCFSSLSKRVRARRTSSNLSLVDSAHGAYISASDEGLNNANRTPLTTTTTTTTTLVSRYSIGDNDDDRVTKSRDTKLIDRKSSVTSTYDNVNLTTCYLDNKIENNAVDRQVVPTSNCQSDHNVDDACGQISEPVSWPNITSGLVLDCSTLRPIADMASLNFDFPYSDSNHNNNGITASEIQQLEINIQNPCIAKPPSGQRHSSRIGRTATLTELPDIVKQLTNCHRDGTLDRTDGGLDLQRKSEGVTKTAHRINRGLSWSGSSIGGAIDDVVWNERKSPAMVRRTLINSSLPRLKSGHRSSGGSTHLCLRKIIPHNMQI
jgi:hypothetical protein